MFQDVKPRRSLKDILPNREGSRRRPEEKVSLVYAAGSSSTGSNGGRRRIFKWISLLVSAAAITALFFFGSGFLAVATVEVTAKQVSVVFNEILGAVRAPAAGAPLTFEAMTTEWKKVSRTVTASAKEKVSRQASGQIIIYNNDSKKPFELVANTRFEAPKGKIFKIKERVIIPGQKLENNKLTPGSVEVVVYAAEPGADYNVGLVDFVIPGLRGSPFFQKVYARAKTPLAGGFVGETKTIPRADEERIRAELRQELRRDLIAAARFQMSPSLILYEGAVTVNFRSNQLPPSSAEQGDSVMIEESGQLNGIVFNRRQLSLLLAQRGAPDFAGQPVEIQGLDQLKLTPVTNFSGPLEEIKKVSVQLEGPAEVVGMIQIDQLQTKLAELETSEVKAAFQEFPLIESARVTLWPPWWTRLPSEPSKIRVKIIDAGRLD